MNVKVKVSILLSISLIAGVLIGLLIAPLLQRNIIERRIENFREPQRFVDRMIENIEPDESQKIEIENKLSLHHKRMIDLHSQIRIQMDSLKSDLDSVLTPEQKEKLDKMLRVGKPFHGKHRDERGRFHKKRNYKRKEYRGDVPPPPPPPPPPQE